MNSKIDILENEILEKYPDVLDILLRDYTTDKNILWATNNYVNLGPGYHNKSEILPELITGSNGILIMPRVQKDKALQQDRARNMAEVFTPSWICNSQNNLIDEAWFRRKNVFNRESTFSQGGQSWKVNPKKIVFPQRRTWRDYIMDKRLEVACGEAPYITSRYDTTTGEFIPISERIGLLDRKLRVINENVHTSGAWLKAAQLAFKSIYAYEWQGDSLLLAREAMLFSFIENYSAKFDKEPLVRSIQYIAKVISWNVWQMDGLKGVVPNSCIDKKRILSNLFGENESTIVKCEGCDKDRINEHTGIYCFIKDWSKKDEMTGRIGRRIRYIDLLHN